MQSSSDPSNEQELFVPPSTAPAPVPPTDHSEFSDRSPGWKDRDPNVQLSSPGWRDRDPDASTDDTQTSADGKEGDSDALSTASEPNATEAEPSNTKPVFEERSPGWTDRDL